MNKFNVKLMSSAMLIAMMANVISPAISLASSVLSSGEGKDALAWAYDTGLTSYNTEDAFMPYATLSREAGAKFLSAFATDVLGTEVDTSLDCNFSDAANIDPTLVSSVTTACGQGLLRGANGKFMPTSTMTKAQFIVALVRGLDGDKAEAGVSPWYENYCTYAQENGITNETDCAALDRPVTRYEALLMLYRGSADSTDTGVVDPTTDTGSVAPSVTPSTGTTVAGDVSITRSENTPGVQYVPGTGSNIQVLKFDVAAGDSDVKISSISFKLEGLVSRDRVMIAVADVNGVRLSNERSFNTNFEALVTANTANGITVPKNSVKSFYAIVSTNGSINERFTVSIADAKAVSSTATVGGTFPIVSNQVNTTQYASQTMTFDGKYTAAASTTANKLYVGDVNKQLGSFQLRTAAANARDVMVKNIRLRSTDNLVGILGNLKLEVNGVVVSSNSIVDGKYVTFVFDSGFVIPYGNSKTFYIKGDVIGGQRTNVVQFYLDRAIDVVALEQGTNASLAMAIGSAGAYLDYFKLEEGKNQITRTDNLYNMNVPFDARNVLGMTANINATSEMSVDTIRVYAAGSAIASGAIERVKLYVNGLLVDEATTAGTDTLLGKYYDFSFFGTLKAGPNSVEVRFDTVRSGVNGQQIAFEVKGGLDSLKGSQYITTNNSVVATEINGNAKGTTLFIKNAGIDNISITNPANPQIEVLQSKNLVAMKFSIRANNVRDIVVRGLNVNMTTPGSNPGYVDGARLFQGTTQLDSQSFSNGTTVVFNSINTTIPAGSSKEFTVYVDTNSSLPTASATDLKFTATNFVVEDAAGNSIANTLMVSGNNIDVKGAVNVSSNRTAAIQAGVIPASTSAGVKVGSFELKTDYDSALVQEVTLVNLVSTFAPLTVDNSTLGCLNATPCANLNYSSDGMYVDLKNNGNLIGSAQILNGVAYVVLNSGMSVSNTSPVNLDIEVRGSSVINAAGDTNKQIKLGVLNVGSTLGVGNGQTAQTLVSPTSSSVSVTSAFTNLVFNTQTIRATKITFANQATPANTTLASVAGQTQVTLFKTVVTADSSKSANLYKIVFNHTTSAGMTTSNFGIKLDGGSTVLSSADANCTLASGKVTCIFGGTYTNGLTIAAGGSRTIELVADTSTLSGLTTSRESINTTLAQGAYSNYAMTTAA
jgi:hypothetical protein